MSVGGEAHPGGALGRLLGAIVGLALLVTAFHYARGSAARDPVGAVQGVLVRFPFARDHIPIDRFGPPCNAGHAAACTDLGLAYTETRKSSDGALPPCLDQALFDRGCRGGDWRGCRQLTRAERDASCAAPDLDAARETLDDACRRLVFEACDALTQL